ncbi:MULTISPECIES: transporter substrate-binding domain-containing protein [Mesorhizobium]|uniref:transporter substrate-binding domain-containing protein n=2 Tax=Phyllobacteriaceae TaxID=69277 RepID=UPI001CCE58D4|nr:MULTISPECIES: transporter substrate-binding domain-containing protein [Mesorhizobium]WIE92705.1 transporter substrate-binding domain-containing protein [Mesorhizobium sp. WSM4875]MBZ9799837.1 transporter substrate-binding domain-containing protein [Mesorhizobium sp. ES1-4]MDF3211924.1 transporter substrate-binding domain-containing protein [Mesorhizobium sp. LMG15046]MDF3234263.1 transporter substrate-binding domain-containing protein [Mesorhizobium sp. DSM 30133]MDG4856376.1 transporter su
MKKRTPNNLRCWELIWGSDCLAFACVAQKHENRIEPVVTEWGSLVPGLQASRFDFITAGMWIKPERCRNVLFSEPIATERGALLVPKGNPEGLHSYEDVRDKGLTFVSDTGYTAVQDAKKSGIADDKIMQVAGPPADRLSRRRRCPRLLYSDWTC